MSSATVIITAAVKILAFISKMKINGGVNTKEKITAVGKSLYRELFIRIQQVAAERETSRVVFLIVLTLKN